MGNTFEIQVWSPCEGDLRYKYVEYWRGEGLLQMLIHMVKAKRAGYDCIALYWR